MTAGQSTGETSASASKSAVGRGASAVPEAAPGPDLIRFKRHPERAYGGPATHGASAPPAPAPGADAAAAAERYYARLPEAAEPPMPRVARALGVGGWVIGGAMCVYMVLYADFGDKEHVFSPVRRAFHTYTHDLFTLSPSERNMLGLERDSKSGDAVEQGGAAAASPVRSALAAAPSLPGSAQSNPLRSPAYPHTPASAAIAAAAASPRSPSPAQSTPWWRLW